MSFLAIIPSYLYWHYTEAFKDMTRVWTNVLWFLASFFSLGLLLRTFFAPWRRIAETRKSGTFGVENIAEVIVTNTVMRVLGAVMRLCIIFVGALAILVVFWGGLALYLAWLLLPALAPLSFLYGFLSITLL